MNRGVPNYVKHALVQAAKHNEKARQFERKIERWLEQHDIHDLDVVRDILIDCTQLENRPDEAIRRLEDVIDSVRQYKAYYKQTGKSRASKVQQASASPKQASASPKQASASPKQGGRYRDITAEI